jgi:hypothetical protein
MTPMDASAQRRRAADAGSPTVLLIHIVGSAWLPHLHEPGVRRSSMYCTAIDRRSRSAAARPGRLTSTTSAHSAFINDTNTTAISRAASADSGAWRRAASWPAAAQWGALVALSALVSVIWGAAGLPAALLLGPMVGGIVLGVNGVRLVVPRLPYLGAQAVVGASRQAPMPSWRSHERVSS